MDHQALGTEGGRGVNLQIQRISERPPPTVGRVKPKPNQGGGREKVTGRVMPRKGEDMCTYFHHSRHGSDSDRPVHPRDQV